MNFNSLKQTETKNIQETSETCSW